jgi:hypothetical protein
MGWQHHLRYHTQPKSRTIAMTDSPWATLGTTTHTDFPAWYTEHFTSISLKKPAFLGYLYISLGSRKDPTKLTARWLRTSLEIARNADRRLFVTQDGMVGNGPGDLVVGCRGADAPCLVRRDGEGGRCRLVAQYFVPSLGGEEPEWAGEPERLFSCDGRGMRLGWR